MKDGRCDDKYTSIQAEMGGQHLVSRQQHRQPGELHSCSRPHSSLLPIFLLNRFTDSQPSSLSFIKSRAKARRPVGGEKMRTSQGLSADSQSAPLFVFGLSKRVRSIESESLYVYSNLNFQTESAPIDLVALSSLILLSCLPSPFNQSTLLKTNTT